MGRNLLHRTLKAAIFQRNPPTAFLASQAGDLISSVRFSLPASGGLSQRTQAAEERCLPGARPLPRRPRAPTVRRPRASPGLPGASGLLTAPRSAVKFLRAARRPRWGDAGGGPGRRRPGKGLASLPGPEGERRPRPPPAPPPHAPPAEPPRPPAELLPAPLPAARPARPLPAERRGACCFLLGMLLGPRSRRLSRRRSSRGAGTRGPGRGRNSAARPTLASSPRAPGSGRAAVRGAPLAWTAAPGAAQEAAAAAAARAASRPPGCGRSARGLGAEPGVIPGAGRGRSGGRSEGRPAARAPCCRLPAAAVLLAGAPPGAAAGAALRLPPRAESLRAQLSLRLAPGGAGVAASVFSARVAACSLYAGEADPGCPFPPRT